MRWTINNLRNYKAIQKSELGINPANDGKIIRLVFPSLTEEHRKELVKALNKKTEDAKVNVRNIRRDILEVFKNILGVDAALLETAGAVSAPVAEAMAKCARKVLEADIAVSVTGLAGPGGDEFGNPVGRVYIGFCDANISTVREFTFSGDREAIRKQTAEEALKLVLKYAK